MTPALAGQIAVCWIVLGFIASPYIGRALRRRRIAAARKHFQETKAKVVLNRAEMENAVRSDLKGNAKLERMRRAEALGFVQDDDESGPFIEQKRKAQ